jgi:hypothetical protein
MKSTGVKIVMNSIHRDSIIDSRSSKPQTEAGKRVRTGRSRSQKAHLCLLATVPEYAWVCYLAPLANCSGKKFAEVEFITCLATILMGWTIHLADGWTKEDVRGILNASVQHTTIKPGSSVPIVFKKRATIEM